MNIKSWKWINAVAFAVTVAVNALANLLRLGGRTTGQVSDAYPNLFTPTPFTFAVWGVIGLGMAAFVLYQCEFFDSGKISAAVRNEIGILFAISCAFNTAWVFFWHFDLIGISVVCIIGLLLSLILINHRLRRVDGNFLSRLTVNAGFEIYLGWIIAAVISNISVWLVKCGWQAFTAGAVVWTVVVLALGAVIGALSVLIDCRWLTALTVVWAYAGVLIRHISSSGFDGAYPAVIIAAAVGIAVILGAAVYKIVFTPCRPCGKD